MRLVRRIPAFILTAVCSLCADSVTAGVVHVSLNAVGDGSGTTWENACPSINAGLVAVASGDEIWVAGGRYLEAMEMVPGVALYGGFVGNEGAREERDWEANETIIDAIGTDFPGVYGADEATLDGFTVTGANHSGVYCLRASPVFRNCRIQSNAATNGGGVYCQLSFPEFVNCVFMGNTAQYGAGIFCDRSTPRLANCVFVGNEASLLGGVADCRVSSPMFHNCTLAGNKADIGGDGISCFYDSFPTFVNCILWEDEPILIGPGGRPGVCWSTIRGGHEGPGNIDADPLFVQPWDGETMDLHLQPGSPCIDTGNPDALFNDACLPPGLGTERCDMGAYGGQLNCDRSAPLYTFPTCVPTLTPTPTPTITLTPTITPSPTPRPKIVYVALQDTGDRSGTSWENACSSISAALDLSIRDDEIWIGAGRYREPIEMKAGVALYGGFVGTESVLGERNWMANETIIDATGHGTPTVVGASYARLDGLTITGGERSGIRCEGSAPIIANCTIANNTSVVGGGVYCDSFAALRFVSCTITENEALYGGAVYGDQADLSFINCTIANNTASSGGAVMCAFTSLSFENCTIAGNNTDFGGAVGSVYNFDYHGRERSRLTAVNSILWNTGLEFFGGLDDQRTDVTYSCIYGGWPGKGNIRDNPRFHSPDSGDFRLRDGSPCIDAGLLPGAPEADANGQPRPGVDGLVDMGAFESPPEYESSATALHHVYVRPHAEDGGDGSSWDEALSSIQSALSVIAATGEIWVAGGTYHERVVLLQDIAIFGGFTATETARQQRDWILHETIVDVPRSTADAGYGVWMADGATLDGFTIAGTEGYAGVYCGNASPVIANCTIRGGPRTRGSGLSCGGASPTVRNCTITQNTAGRGAGVTVFLGAPILIDCVIVENSATAIGDGLGGGIYSENSSLTVENCTIARNSAIHGGGLYVRGNSHYAGSTPAFVNCTIAENTARHGGGGYSFGSSPSFIGCLVARNVASRVWGGGLFCNEGNMTLTNCTFADNSFGGLFGYRWLPPSPWARITNCIFWDVPINSPDDIANIADESEVTFSCIRGGWPGEGNTDADPLFVDPDNGDYHLRDGSPCVDSGLTWEAPNADVEGNTRPGADGFVDLGAYESPPHYSSNRSLTTERIYVRSDAEDGGDGASWASALNSISGALIGRGAGKSGWLGGRTMKASGCGPASRFTGDSQVRKKHATIATGSLTRPSLMPTT